MHSISLPLSSEQWLLAAQLKNPPDLSKLSVRAPSYKEKGDQKVGQEQKQLEATKAYSEVCPQLRHAIVRLPCCHVIACLPALYT